MSHTPGPWKLLPLSGRKYYGTEVSIGDGRITVWTSNGGKPSTREIENGWQPDYGMDHVESDADYANARLIASAPDLLAAAHEAENALMRHDDERSQAALARIRSVIAGAEGR